MANEILWLPKTVETLMTAGDLNNQPDATMLPATADYNNASNKYRFGSFLFFGTFDAPCDAGALAELHLFYKLDGTNYGDGEDGDVAAPVGTGNSLHGLFQIGVTTVVYQQVLGVPLLPYAFRVGLKLATGQDLTPVATHFLKIAPSNEEIQ